MSRIISNNALREVADRLKNCGGRATLSAILRPGETRSTLLRHISVLVSQGIITVEGRGKRTEYLLVDARESTDRLAPQESSKELSNQDQNVISFSKKSPELRGLLHQTITSRTPVGYIREFLESYIPNTSSYLSKNNLARLQAIGTAISPSEQAPAGTYAKQVLSRLLIELSWNSSRLEGNTYTLLDTQRLIEKGIIAQGKDAQDTQMILNHKSAIEFIVDSAFETGMNAMTIRNIHAILSDNLLDPPELSGTLRRDVVAIGGSVYIPLSNRWAIEKLFEVLTQKAAAIKEPFEQAFFIMLHLPYLQPFIDVNKRTSRLVANIPLIWSNLYPLSFTDVPEDAYVDAMLAVYEFQRTEPLEELFVWAYEKSALLYRALRTQIGQPDPFRARYREQLIQAVGMIVRGALDSKGLLDWSLKNNVTLTDVEQFSKITTNEIDTLHEGNFARFRIRPSEWEKWKRLK